MKLKSNKAKDSLQAAQILKQIIICDFIKTLPKNFSITTFQNKLKYFQDEIVPPEYEDNFYV